MTLPQRILLWTEPDMEEAGNRHIKVSETCDAQSESAQLSILKSS